MSDTFVITIAELKQQVKEALKAKFMSKPKPEFGSTPPPPQASSPANYVVPVKLEEEEGKASCQPQQ